MFARNLADTIVPPKVERAQMQTYDIGQAADLQEAVRGTPLFIAANLAVSLGLSRGEVAALR